MSGSLGRPVYVIAESDLNDARVISPTEIGGYGVDAQWNDDFHHALHTLITGDNEAYYQDFGTLAHMVKALSEGFVYSGQYSSHRKRRHGNSSKERPAHQFVVFSQTHDQVGNRPERPSRTQSLEQLKLAAAVVLLSPYVPLLFMGEEYAEKPPFVTLWTSRIVRLTKRCERADRRNSRDFDGRRKFRIRRTRQPFSSPGSTLTVPDLPEQTMLLQFYKELILLRKSTPILASVSRECFEVNAFDNEKILAVRRWSDDGDSLCLYGFSDTVKKVSLFLPAGRWVKIIDSSAETWGGH